MSKLTPKETEVWRRYHIPGTSAMHRLKVDAIFFNTNNSELHEVEKARIGFEIKKNGGHFICEAQRNSRDSNGKIRRVDIVDLTSDIEFEIETDPKRAERFEGEEGVIVIPVGEKWKKEQQGKE